MKDGWVSRVAKSKTAPLSRRRKLNRYSGRVFAMTVPNVDLPAISSPNFKPGPPVDEAQVFSQQIYDLLIS
jgi:hypothetical protein